MKDEITTALNDIQQEYPALAGYDWTVIDSRGKKSKHGGMIEFYHPDEKYNPAPGKPTIEVFDKNLTGETLKRAIFGDMLHFLPGVDPKFSKYREEFRQTITPDQSQIDLGAYKRSVDTYGEARPYFDWFDQSRLDAYLRGYIAPDQNDEWRKSGTYTPQQTEVLDEIIKHLRGAQ